MAATTPITAEEAEQIRELTLRIGDRRLRTILTREGARLVRPERLANMEGGTARLSAADRKALNRAWSNRVAISNLGKRGDKLGKREFQTNRAIRTWLLHGKSESQRRRKDKDELDAIKALRFLGIDPDEGLYYLRGVTTA